MGALMRSFDWESTPLGPPATWCQTLQMMTRMLLNNSFPILLWWGPDFIQLYNDAYIPVLGDKHPQRSLGRPFRECWSEVYSVLGPLAQGPFQGGPPTWIEDISVELNRYAYIEEAHFTISYSAVADPTAPRGIGGVVAIVHEISDKVVGDRRVLALRDLASRSVEAKTAEDACAEAARTLAAYRKDVPFVLVYLLDESGEVAHLAGKAETEDCSDLCPPTVTLNDAKAAWPMEQCLRAEEIVLVNDLASRFQVVPAGPWSDPPNTAAVVPIQSQVAHRLAGFLIVGISARLRFDDAYKGFLDLASAQIATSVANARAHQMERRRNEALAEVDRAKTIFFSNISHELRTPLTLILGPVEDLLTASGKLIKADRERLEMVHGNTLRLLKLVNTLLDFSRMEAGRFEASFEPVDLPLLTAELAGVFRATIERGGLRLNVDCPPLPDPVYVDRGMWEKVIFNLLSNAFKFTFAGEIGVTIRESKSAVQVTVSDTGTGIAAEELPQLFKRFHRIRGAKGRSYEGSGIGLALVQELVKLHGGTIGIESKVGRGSRFTLTIPLGCGHLPPDRLGAARAPASMTGASEAYVREAERWLANEPASLADESDEAAKRPGVEKELVLVADDNADLRHYITRLLETQYRVLAVSDGARAIEEIQRLRPSLVIADVMMPGVDGFGLLNAVRTHPELHGIPVILLSARAGEESRVEGLHAGADDYMVKPFSARELLARVESHLALKRLRQKADQEIRESEARFRALVEASSDAIYRMNPDWTVMWRLVGHRFIEDTDAPDRSWLERYILPEDHERVIAAIETAIRTKSVFELEHRVKLANGSPGWTFSRAVPMINEIGEITEWFGTATDITGRKRAEEALLRSEKMASLGRMAATISHEINNPLEALGNLIYLACLTDELPASAAELLQRAEAELQRVAHITRQSLGFYRETVAAGPVSIETVLDLSIDLLKDKIGARKTRVERQVRTRQKVTAVAGELRQVFTNLLANSLDAVGENGMIKVRVSSVCAPAGQGQLRITIADNGKGISPDARTHIFDPLFTTKGAIGTGLGLWVAKEIIEKHRGAIRMRSCTSGPRVGTTFRLTLPL
jgi:PAS domain S-box-containing protein